MVSEVFAYEKLENGIKIWRCYSYDEQVLLPDFLEELPVVELAPYLFSAHMDQDTLRGRRLAGTVKLASVDGKFTESEDSLPPEVCGMKLGIVGLPKTVKRIGRYAFYNCSHLKRIEFYSGIEDLGSGLFTGCHHVEELAVHVMEDGTSCFRQILTELAEEMRVDYYENDAYCRLIFPEYFEEGGEDTPAKNTKITYHGSGLHFRNCFKENRFQFAWYDERFIRAQSWDRGELVLELALLRLLYPVELSDPAKSIYVNYMLDHLYEAGAYILTTKNMSQLIWFLDYETFRNGITADLLEHLTELARKMENMEAVSFLMERKHQKFPPKAKCFDL